MAGQSFFPRKAGRAAARAIPNQEPITHLTVKAQKVITLEPAELLEFCGHNDQRLRKIQGKLKAKIVPRGNEIRLQGTQEEVDAAHRTITDLLEAQRHNAARLTDKQLHHALLQQQEEGSGPHVQGMLRDIIPVPNPRLRLTPLTLAQMRYVQAIREKDIVFCIGPAGTGKTYLAMAMAVHYLMEKRVTRLVLVRPAVEAGENLGFLPGDIAQKLDPYVRPLYDALYEMVEAEKVREMIEHGTVEIAPLAYMRGRTLNNAFVILDEAQNSSVEQMKMFLTRMGFGSKMLITGDITQIDLARGKPSGLVHVQKVLGGVPEIEFINFTGKDVVRHELVQKIIAAYETHGKT